MKYDITDSDSDSNIKLTAPKNLYGSTNYQN